MSLVNVHCNFTNSIVTSGVEIPYQGKLEEVFNYSVSDYNDSNNNNDNNSIAGFNNVRYKMKYPDNDNTTIFSVDEGNNEVKKYLKISLSDSDKTNKFIGIHDDILIPLDINYSKEGNFITNAAKEAATSAGKELWKIVGTKAVQAIPYVGSVIAGLLSGGGTILRQAAQLAWQNGRNLLPGPGALPAPDVNVRSVKLYKNNEIPVIDKQTRSVDLVRQDDPNVPGDDNIVDDEEEPIWAGKTEAVFDILEELEYTMTSNNDTFTFDIDEYNEDPIVAAAPEGSARPIGMKRVKIHTNIPPNIPEMDTMNPVEIQSNGTYGIQYETSSNELDIVQVNNNRSISNVGTFTVDVPSVPTQTKSVTYTSNDSYTISPDPGYNLSQVSVDVNVPSVPTQAKSVSYNAPGNYTVSPDNGYNLSQVNIEVNLPTMSDTPLELQTNGLYDIVYNSTRRRIQIVTHSNNNTNVIGKFSVGVPVVPTQTKSVTYNNNGSYTVSPDSGYDLSQVNVDVDVSAPSMNLQSKSVTVVGTGSTSVVADSGYSGLSRVNISYYSSGSDVPVIGNNPIYVKSVKISNSNDLYDLISGGTVLEPNNSISNLRSQLLIWYFDNSGLKMYRTSFDTYYGYTFVNNFGFDIRYIIAGNSIIELVDNSIN